MAKLKRNAFSRVESVGKAFYAAVKRAQRTKTYDAKSAFAYTFKEGQIRIGSIPNQYLHFARHKYTPTYITRYNTILESSKER